MTSRGEAGAAVTALAFLLLAAASWGTWPDVTVDFGAQLYIPWRISEGEVLYRDLPYLHGALPQYLNALLFRLFGASLTTLVLANLAIAAGTLGLLRALLRRISGELAAAVGGLLFVTLFAFSQLLPTGNYNFVAPYVHEATHGLFLGLLALYLLARHQEGGSPAFAALSGLALGLCFLTKAECFAAALLGCAAMSRRSDRRLPLLAALAPPACAFLLFATSMPAADALQATLGPWRPSLYRAASLPFFRYSLGTEGTPLLGGSITRLLPAGVLALLIATWRRGPLHRGFAVFALALLLKIALNARLYHYGFTLAVPATVLVAGALVGRTSGVVRAAALAAIAAVAVVHLERSASFWLSKTVPVGTGRDRFLADARGEVVNRALAELLRRAAPGETLAAVPEGATLNFLARRRNPTGFSTLTPVETTAFGEARVAAAFAANPPDWIALVHKDTAEFGPQYRDHARRLGELLTRGYEPVVFLGEPPPRFGIRLLRRKR